MYKKIQVIYRNYIPLNSPYSSFWTNPPDGISFDIPAPRPMLKYLYPIYSQFRDHPLIRMALGVAQKLLFTKPSDLPAADGYFFVGMLPSEPLKQPYYIDIEHAAALINFVNAADRQAEVQRVSEILNHPNCKSIIPISHAALASIRQVFGDAFFRQISEKTRVIYPALPCYRDKWGQNLGEIRQDNSELKVLFVGVEPRRKGLFELIEACSRLADSGVKIELTAITKHHDLIQKKRNFDLRLLLPRFKTEELMQEYMIKSDVFVLPTYIDSFGMVILEAMSCGTPVVATHQFAIPEMIRNGIEGYLLDHDPLFVDRDPPQIPTRHHEFRLDSRTHEQIVSGLEDSLRRLANDPLMRQRMGEAGMSHFRDSGKFSLVTRNRQLQRIFDVNSTHS
jgi:glycosyltransferase involved in cell wall biosynthesis